MAVVLTLSMQAAPAAHAATAKEALKCGLAQKKLQLQLVVLVAQALVTLCKEPEELSPLAAKITAKVNKSISRINAKFSNATCDPDFDQLGGLPLPLFTQDSIEAQLKTANFPGDELCNNVDDVDTEPAVSCTGVSSGSECTSGVCAGSFVDADGDGFGVGAIDFFCGPAAPAGRALQAGDCCDSDSGAHPGQGAFFTTARACGGFDFNCDGAQEKQFAVGNTCKTFGSCAASDLSCLGDPGDTGWSGSVPACGASATFVTACASVPACNAALCSDCTICSASTTTRLQGCR